MPAVARANGTDTVLSPDGVGKDCAFPVTVATGSATQTRVTADKKPLVVVGDISSKHRAPGCKADDLQKLTSSSRVSATKKKIARIGDTYGNNTITSGSSRVFAN